MYKFYSKKAKGITYEQNSFDYRGRYGDQRYAADSASSERLPGRSCKEIFRKPNLRRNRTKGNTGLGLAIVKEFTEMLNGSVSVQNADSLFTMTVSFPME